MSIIGQRAVIVEVVAADVRNDADVKLDPGRAITYVARGVAYAGIGQRDLACRDWGKACDMGNTEICEWLREKKKC